MNFDTLKSPWHCTQIGLLCLPLSPLLGAIILFIGVLISLKQNFRQISNNRLYRVLGGLAVWLVLMSFFADYQTNAWLGLFNFLPFFLMFVSFSQLLKTAEQLRYVAWILVLGSVPVVLIGLGQLYLGWQGPVILLGGVINWILAPAGNPVGRMSSVFEYANVLANYLVITFSLALGLWLENWTLFRNHQSDKYPLIKHKILPKLLILNSIIFLNIIGLILTDSRNAWGLGLGICLIYGFWVGWRWLSGAVLALISVILGSAFAPSPLREGLRFLVPKYFWARLTDELFIRPAPSLRITQWNFAGQGTFNRPITGWGFNNFPTHYYQHFAPFYQGQALQWPQHPHNLFLMLSYEAGLPATFLFLGIIGLIIVLGFLFLFDKINPSAPLERSIMFTFLITFLATTIFHLFDVTLFDLRINVLGWLLLAGILGLQLDNNHKFKRFF